MNQVKVDEKSRIAKVLEGIGMFFKALSVNTEIVNDIIDEQVEEIKAQQDNKKISKLEEETLEVNISLKDKVVESASVSEIEAQKAAKSKKVERTIEDKTRE